MRVSILSDLHGDALALEAISTDARNVDAVWCLGDTIGEHGDDPTFLDRVRMICAIHLAGNHELMRFEALGGDGAMLRASATLHLPDFGRIALCHGSPNDPFWGFIARQSAGLEIRSAQARLILHGHTHRRQCYRCRIGDPIETVPAHLDVPIVLDAAYGWAVGVGMARRDRKGRSHYAILDTAAETVTFRRVQT